MSGIPDIGTLVRKSATADLRATLSMGGALRMLRDASHHERSNRTRMHVTALGCPQHEADDAHAARGTFRNPAGHFVLIVEAASQPGPHTRDSERMVIEIGRSRSIACATRSALGR